MKKYTDLGVCFLVVFIIVAGTLYAQGFFRSPVSGESQGFWPPPFPPVLGAVSWSDSAQPEGHAITVSQMQSMPDKSYAILRGDIIQRVEREKYTFRDSTGETTVKIKNKNWGELTAGPSDRIEILVELEYKKGGTIEVEAKSIMKY